MNDYIGREGLLSRLSGVKQTGPDQYMVLSPTRAERTPSLSIRFTEDGRVLLHDFGGSDAAEILAALGLNWVQLIPPHLRRDRHACSPAERQGHDAMAALNAMHTAALIVRICANRMADGHPLEVADHHALRQAQHDITTALNAVRGVQRGR